MRTRSPLLFVMVQDRGVGRTWPEQAGRGLATHPLRSVGFALAQGLGVLAGPVLESP